MKNFLLTSLLCFCAILTQAQTKSKMSVHEVAKGETLYSISKKYHTTVDAIAKANKGIGPDLKIKPGLTLHIPAAGIKTEAKATSTKPEPKKAENVKAPPVEKKATATAKPATTIIEPTSDNASSHVIAKGESLYSLAKANGVYVKQLRDANNMTEESKIKIGQRLRIPAKNVEAIYKPASKQPSSEVRVEEKAVVKPTEPKAIQSGREYLQLASDNPPAVKKEVEKKEVEPARPVIVPVRVTDDKPNTPVVTDKPKEVVKEEKAPEPKEPKSPPAEAVKNTNVAPSTYSAVFNDYVASGKKKVVYRGIGSFLQSENPGNQYLALYNYADMGAILKVTNLMSKQAIYVKVIGKVPATDAQNEIILKVSSEAATQLKVAEDKFLVEVTGYNAQ